MTVLAAFLQAHGLTGSDSPLLTKTAGRKDLCALFYALGFRRGAEIGVYSGRFSEQICLANPGVHLLCVDPWKAYADYHDPKNLQDKLDTAYDETQRRLAPYGCEIQRKTSTAAADGVPDGSLDFVYIDGNHAKSYVLADLHAWAKKVRSGGIVAGHDYEVRKRHDHLQVTDAVDEYTRQQGIRTFYVLMNDKTPSFFWVVA